MALPMNADVIVVHGYWVDELTGGGVKQDNGRPATVMFDPVPLLGGSATKTPNLRDIATNTHLKTRSRVAMVDSTTGYFATLLVASNDPDLDAYGGRRVTLLGEDPFVIEVPYNALSTTVDAAMASATGLTPGSSVKAVWLTDATVVGTPPPQPPTSYLTSVQTLSSIATAIEGHDEDGTAHSDIRALIGSGSVADATTSTKGKAKLLGGTADAPTVPYSAVTGAPRSLHDTFTGSGTLSVAESGGTWLLTNSSAAGAGLSRLNGKLTNTTTVAGAAAGYAEQALPGPVTSFSSTFVLNPGTNAGNATMAVWKSPISASFPTIPDSPMHLAVLPDQWILSTITANALTQLGGGTFTSPLATDGTTQYAVTVDLDYPAGRVTITFPDHSIVHVTDPSVTANAGAYACLEVYANDASVGARAGFVSMWADHQLTQVDADARYARPANLAYVGASGNAAAQAGNVETLPRFNATDVAGVSGQLWAAHFTPPVTTTISQLGISQGATVAATPTVARLALFTVASDGSLTKVAQTANDTTIGASAAYTADSRALSTVGGYPATYTLTGGTRYAIGWLNVAATPASLFGVGLINPLMPPIICRYITGQSDIAASYAVGSLTTHYLAVYFFGLV